MSDETGDEICRECRGNPPTLTYDAKGRLVPRVCGTCGSGAQPTPKSGSTPDPTPRDESGDTITLPRAVVEQADTALRRAGITLIALVSSEPYPDDPRWSPWTRFASPACGRIDAARKALKEALDA